MAAMAKEIGADRCIFQELPDLVAAIVECAEEQGSDLKSLDCSCFDGKVMLRHRLGLGLRLRLRLSLTLTLTLPAAGGAAGCSAISSPG